MRITPLAIPMRARFEHASAVRDTADPLVVRLAAAAPYAELTGYGETLARPYVTGETPASVMEDLTREFAPLLVSFQPQSFADALEFIEQLPFEAEGRIVCAARAALELALVDLAGRTFRRRAADMSGWMGLPGFGPPGCIRTARYSGMIIGKSRRRLGLFLNMQRAYRLRDFKIKVGVDGWEERLAWAGRNLAKPIKAGRATLRADANGAWTLAEAHNALPVLERHGVSALEQPLPEAADGDLAWLAEQTACDLIADESLLTLEDARRLIDGGGVKVLNIRIAKNGGLMPSLRIARTALNAGLDVQLGCLVGETSLLSAAGAAFLEACPEVRFVEGAFGRWLLKDDVTRYVVQFGFGGRLKPRTGFGLGVKVDEKTLTRRAAAPTRIIRF